MNKMFLKTDKTSIVDGHGGRVLLKGVNFGGWLMMEAYFVHAPNLPQQIFEKEFTSACGAKALKELVGKFFLKNLLGQIRRMHKIGFRHQPSAEINSF